MSATKATEAAPGVSSSFRVILLAYVAPLSAALILGGLVGFFLRLTDAPLVIGAGTGLLTLALGAKAWQAQAEERS